MTLALIAGGGLVAVNGGAGDDDSDDAGTTATVSTAEAERRTLEEHTGSLSGELLGEPSAELGAKLADTEVGLFRSYQSM